MVYVAVIRVPEIRQYHLRSLAALAWMVIERRLRSSPFAALRNLRLRSLTLVAVALVQAFVVHVGLDLVIERLDSDQDFLVILVRCFPVESKTLVQYQHRERNLCPRLCHHPGFHCGSRECDHLW